MMKKMIAILLLTMTCLVEAQVSLGPVPGTPGLLVKVLSISEAQLEALGTTPLEIVPAPGASTIAVPVSWIVETKTTTGYSTNPTMHLQLGATTFTGEIDINLTGVGTTLRTRSALEHTGSSDFRNLPINVDLTADPGTPGTGIAISRVTVFYRLVDSIR